ncbi:hypothetical protein LZ30DRAFT_251061 [Colletotrichum cereale]|nr:hypothetical protein LZ30DRAFT_251061 [Colletotrichum cereale]
MWLLHSSRTSSPFFPNHMKTLVQEGYALVIDPPTPQEIKASKLQGQSFPTHPLSLSSSYSCKTKAALTKTSAAIVESAIAYLQRSKLDRGERRCEGRYETTSQAHNVLFHPEPCKKRKEEKEKKDQGQAVYSTTWLAGQHVQRGKSCVRPLRLYILWQVYGQLVLYE